jgi:hypothetical protein
MADSGALQREAGQPSSAAAGRASAFASPRYYACLLLVGLSALATHLLAGVLRAYFEKQALPLKAALYRLDAAKLAPYERAARQPDPLGEELLDSLGTREYLNWILVDPRLTPTDPAYMARVFITYYTGQPDMVPHEPRECMQAAGWDLVSEERFEIELTPPGGPPVQTPIAVLGFEPPGAAGQPEDRRPRLHVMYFFNANGRFATDRTGVRVAVANLMDRFAYYAKVEISFQDERGARLASRPESEAALRRLLPRLMRTLWEDHLPDWAAATGRPAAQ